MYFKTRSDHRTFNHSSTNALDGMVVIHSLGQEPNTGPPQKDTPQEHEKWNKRFYWLNIVFVTLFFFFFEQSQIAKEGVFRVQVELVLRLHPVFNFLFRQNNLRRDLKKIQSQSSAPLLVKTQLQRSCNILSRYIDQNDIVQCSIEVVLEQS